MIEITRRSLRQISFVRVASKKDGEKEIQNRVWLKPSTTPEGRSEGVCTVRSPPADEEVGQNESRMNKREKIARARGEVGWEMGGLGGRERAL